MLLPDAVLMDAVVTDDRKNRDQLLFRRKRFTTSTSASGSGMESRS